MPAYTWRGVTRNGENRQGRTAMEPSELTTFVEQRFGKGWRDLTVSLDDIQVGGICRQAVRPARRIWWPTVWEEFHPGDLCGLQRQFRPMSARPARLNTTAR